MRVTNQMYGTTMVRYMQQAEARQLELFEKIASGKKINKPSDDPMGVKKVISIRDELIQVDRYKQNNDEAQEWINFSEQSLGGIVNKLEVAISTAAQAKNATVDSTMKEMFATQITELLESVVSDANTQFNDKYLYGGTLTNKAPFNLTNEVEEDLAISSFGEEIKLSQLRLTDAAVTVEAGGTSYDSTNFELDREKGTITILEGSQLETDGMTDFTISYKTKDSVVVFPEDGDTKGVLTREIMRVDNLQMNISGEKVFVEETNVLNTLRDLKNALYRDDKNDLNQASVDLSDSINQVSKYSGMVALKYEHAVGVSESLDALKLQMESMQSHIEDTDLAEASVNLELTNTNYQAILQTTSQILNISLLDYLR